MAGGQPLRRSALAVVRRVQSRPSGRIPQVTTDFLEVPAINNHMFRQLRSAAGSCVSAGRLSPNTRRVCTSRPESPTTAT